MEMVVRELYASKHRWTSEALEQLFNNTQVRKLLTILQNTDLHLGKDPCILA